VTSLNAPVETDYQVQAVEATKTSATENAPLVMG
jgi:hypothetical protein